MHILPRIVFLPFGLSVRHIRSFFKMAEHAIEARASNVYTVASRISLIHTKDRGEIPMVIKIRKRNT